MYFTAEAQERILGRFHYALKDDGALFLGKAEMLLSHADLFQPVDLKQRIFSKVAPLRLRERRLLPTELGDVETTDEVARQTRVRELATEGIPYPQLAAETPGATAGPTQ